MQIVLRIFYFNGDKMRKFLIVKYVWCLISISRILNYISLGIQAHSFRIINNNLQ
jgi:hypothetical protein